MLAKICNILTNRTIERGFIVTIARPIKAILSLDMNSTAKATSNNGRNCAMVFCLRGTFTMSHFPIEVSVKTK